MEFEVKYKRENRKSWIMVIEGSGFKQFIQQNKSYGFDVEVIPTVKGTVLEVDTHGLGGWEKQEVN